MNLAAELLRYGQHGLSCPRRDFSGGCICGWDAIRKEATYAYFAAPGMEARQGGNEVPSEGRQPDGEAGTPKGD